MIGRAQSVRRQYGPSRIRRPVRGNGLLDVEAKAADTPKASALVTVSTVAPESSTLDEAVAGSTSRLSERDWGCGGSGSRMPGPSEATVFGGPWYSAATCATVRKPLSRAAMLAWRTGRGTTVSRSSRSPGNRIAAWPWPRETAGLLYGCHAAGRGDRAAGQAPAADSMCRASRGLLSEDGPACCRISGAGQWADRPIGFRTTATWPTSATPGARAPSYRINTFSLMGRGEVGELHTFVNYKRWDRLAVHRSSESRRRAKQQAEMLEHLARDAQRFGVRLYLWDHELQLPEDFADAYPHVRGQGSSICLSAPDVWRLLDDKYEEFFRQCPSLAGIVLMLSETQINVLTGSPCQCTGAGRPRDRNGQGGSSSGRYGRMPQTPQGVDCPQLRPRLAGNRHGFRGRPGRANLRTHLR